MALLVGISLIAVGVSLAVNNRADYRYQMAAARTQADGVTLAVATRLADVFGQTQRFLDHAALMVSARAGQGRGPWEPDGRTMVAQLAEDLPMVRGVAVLDRAGGLAFGFGALGWVGGAATREAVLAAHGAHPGPAALFVRLGGDAPAALSRALVGDDGAPTGFLVAAVDFQGLGAMAEVLPTARRLVVSTEDGAALFHDGPAPTGDVPRAERHVGRFPIVVSVDMPTAALEARWLRHGWRDGLSVGALALLLIMLAVIHIRRQGRMGRALRERVREGTEELALVNSRLLAAERIAHLGHWERDIETGAGYWSDENFRIYGLPPGPASPAEEAFYALVHAEDRDAVRRMREVVRTGMDPYDQRFRVVRPDGAVRFVHSQAEVERDASGRSRRLIGTTLDVTALVEAENRLRESEEKYRTVFEVARDPIYLVDSTTHAILETNRAARRIYGYSAEEFRALTIVDLSAEPEKTRAAMRTALPLVPLRRHRRKDGSEFYIELMSARARLGATSVLVMAVRDITERVSAEARLATTKARLILAEQTAHLGHWEWLPESDGHVWSEELFRILGVAPGAPRADWPALLDRVHPEDRAALAAVPDSLERTGDTATREVRVVRPDGEERQLQLKLQVTRDARGAMTCLFGTALDVTERHAAQRAVLESNATLLAIINATDQDMVGLLNPDGTLRVANNKVAEVLGRPMSEIVGQPLSLFASPREAEWRSAMVAEVLATGKALHVEETVGDLVFDTHCAPALGPDGLPIGVAVFARNVTARKQVENDLRKLTRAIEQVPLSVVITDLKGVIEYVNPHFSAATGYAAAEVVGRNPSVLKSGYTTSRDYDALWRTIAAGEVWHGEFHNKRRDGHLFWERASIAPVRDERGVVTHYVAVKEDITQRKRAELELLAAKERAEAANVAKSQFLATVSHELRTPLNAIIGFSDCMREQAFGPIGDERYRRFAGSIHEAGEHLLKLINDIIDLANAESGRFDIAETIVDPRLEVIAAVDAARDGAARANLALSAEVPEHLPLLYADERAIRMVVGNLLSNAVKFTPPGGRVLVEARLEESGLFLLRVSDTGIGIPADKLAQVLEPFGQLNADFTREHEGTGLGLSLCRSMAEMHGGHLEIESAINAGTTVSVRFPRDRVLLPGRESAILAPGLTG